MRTTALRYRSGAAQHANTRCHARRFPDRCGLAVIGRLGDTATGQDIRPRRRMRVTKLLPALAVVAVLAGCGGTKAPDDPKQTLTDLVGHLADGDGGKACALLLPGARDTFARENEAADCEKAVAVITGPHPRTHRPRRSAEARVALGRITHRGDLPSVGLPDQGHDEATPVGGSPPSSLTARSPTTCSATWRSASSRHRASVTR